MTTTNIVEETEIPQQKTVEELVAQIKALKVALSKAKVTKEVSEFFVTAEGQPMKWKNLSETKRFFETTHPEILTPGMSSKTFHALLVSLIGL